MRIIVINNPAARSGGALTILKEFLEKVNGVKCNQKFIVIVSLVELKKYETDKIKIHVVNSQGFKERILWDNIKLKKYLKKQKIKPDLFISIQNTGVNLDKDVPQIIYYHQPLSLVDLQWNFFKKNQRVYWMYKNIYPIFIKQHLNKVRKIIVQTKWVKEEFSKKFGYSKNNIILLRPEIKKINIENIKNISKSKYRIFYPAAPLIYKNHKIIIEALGILKKENLDLMKNIECIFTFGINESIEFDRLIKKYNLENIVKLVGKISYEEVLEYYKSSNLLVFPSYLETFGLPLIEAQQFELDILTIDLPYSREVLQNYKRCEFLLENTSQLWRQKIYERVVKNL